MDVLCVKGDRGMQYAIINVQGHETRVLPTDLRTVVDGSMDNSSETNGVNVSVEPGSQMRKIIRGRFESLCLVYDATRIAKTGDGRVGSPGHWEIGWTSEDFENCFTAEEKHTGQNWLIQ